MKKKFYASLLIWIGLTVVATPSLAKTAQPAAKKQVANSAKPAKTNAHNVASSKKQEQTKTPLAKQKSSPIKNQQLADTKDSKHGKSKAQQLADTKDSKHGKSKAQQLADAKDSKHGKSKAQQLADAKDSKHGKSKTQQLADTKDSKHGKSKAQQLANAKDSKHGKSKAQQLADAKDKHGRKKSHSVVDENYEEESEEDASMVTETDEQVPDENDSVDLTAEQNTDKAVSQATDTAYNEKSNGLIAAPTKPSQLSFQALDKTEVRSLVENSTKPNNRLPPTQAIDNNKQAESKPLFIAPNTQIANNDRIHSSISSGSRFGEMPAHQAIDSSDEEKTPEPREQDELLIPPNNKRIHSSIARGNGNNFIDDSANHETSTHVASTHGVVESSLVSAGEKAGLSNDMVMQLTDIFAWDIDFANNLQAGDQFTVVYEEAGMGKKANNQIIAAQFVNRGKTYIAIRYKDKEGIVSYYTPEGRSLRKAFLSTPVDFARVSSPFSTHRLHPILNRIRAHKGVDYAARTGTPVKAAGDGVITFHGNKGAYGRMIVISHGEHYETAYAHLSDFRKDLQDGEPVKQGEVIGYVGQSGLATGPHLHYEFRVDGVHRDPENLDSKQAMRLAHEEWENFHAQTIPVLTRLNQAKANTLFAKNP